MPYQPDSTDASADFLRQADDDLRSGRITHEQFMQRLSTLAPGDNAVVDTMMRLQQGQQGAQGIAPRPTLRIGRKTY
jgi:hypothetical protein